MGKVISPSTTIKAEVPKEPSTDKPYFAYEQNRLDSLVKFDGKNVSIEHLARFGFYLSEKDNVKCQFCNVVIGNWGEGDDPLNEHYVHSRHCPFLNNVKSTNNSPLGDEIELEEELNRFIALARRFDKSNENAPQTSNESYLPIPRHPDYADFETRLKSFQNWPKMLKQTPEELSEAGFFYLNEGDNVKCFSCSGCLKNWQPNDSVLEEHRKHFANRCHFINTFYGHIKRKLSKSNWRPFNKATPEQIAYLINYMDEHIDLRDKKINSLNQKQLYNEMWKDVVEQLNRIEGPKKTIESWKEVWRNLKYNQKRKVSSKVEKDSFKTENLKSDSEIDSIQSYTTPISENTIVESKLNKEKSPARISKMEVDATQPLSPESQESSDKVLPKKRKLQKYLFDNVNTQSIPIKNDQPSSVDNGTVERERKLEKLELEKLQFEFANERRQWELERQQLKLENLSKQLEIEKLKAQIEMMIVKRELEFEKEELQKERKQIEKERNKT